MNNIAETLKDAARILGGKWTGPVTEQAREAAEEWLKILEGWRASLLTLARKALPELANLPDDLPLNDLLDRLAQCRPGWANLTLGDEEFTAWAAAEDRRACFRDLYKRAAWATEAPDWMTGSSVTGWIRALPFEVLFELLDIEIEARQAEWEKALKRRRELPTHLAQQTAQEIRNAGIALSDGPSGRHWEHIPGEVALRHGLPGEPLQVKLMADGFNQWANLGIDTHEDLIQKITKAGTPAVLCFQIIINLVLKDGMVTLAIDDLIKMVGWDDAARRNQAERAKYRKQIWEWLLIYTNLHIIGARPGIYRDPDTKQKREMSSNDPLVVIAGKQMPPQMTFDHSEPPITVTLTPGAWVERYRGDRRIFPDYGNVMTLAGIPAGKLSGAWAQSIGLALNQKWREISADPSRAKIKRVGEDNKQTIVFKTFTRRELFDVFRPLPEHDPNEILQGPNPKRAQVAWDKAIKILQKAGTIGYCKSIKPLPQLRRGWADAWLDQPLDIRPTKAGMAATAEIQSKARKARKARARPRKNAQE